MGREKKVNENHSKPQTETEALILGNTEKFAQIYGQQGFDLYRSFRDLVFDTCLPLAESKFSSDEIKDFEKQINFVKSLGFVDPCYIDNIILYIEVLKYPLLSKNFLISIIDSRIVPDIRSRGIRPFQKMAAGYFIYHTSKYEGVTLGSAKKAMGHLFGLQQRVLDDSYSKYKSAIERIGDDQEIRLFADTISFAMLMFGFLDLEEMAGQIGQHHLTQRNHRHLIVGYKEFCNQIAYHYLKNNKEAFDTLPHYPDIFFTEEFRGKIPAFFAGKKVSFETNEVVGVLFNVAITKRIPNIAANPELCRQMNLVTPELLETFT